MHSAVIARRESTVTRNTRSGLLTHSAYNNCSMLLKAGPSSFLLEDLLSVYG
jgi:hypothetical protein